MVAFIWFELFVWFVGSPRCGGEHRPGVSIRFLPFPSSLPSLRVWAQVVALLCLVDGVDVGEDVGIFRSSNERLSFLHARRESMLNRCVVELFLFLLNGI